MDEMVKELVTDERRLACLSGMEKQVIDMLFGIGVYDRQYKIKEIAEAIGRSIRRVRQIEAKAFRKMRHPRFDSMENIDPLDYNFHQLFIHDEETKYSISRMIHCLSAEEIYTLRDFKRFKLSHRKQLSLLLLKMPNMGTRSIEIFYKSLERHHIPVETLFPDEKEMQEIIQKEKINYIELLEEKIKSMEQTIIDIERRAIHIDHTLKQSLTMVDMQSHFKAFSMQMNEAAKDIEIEINKKLQKFHHDYDELKKIGNHIEIFKYKLSELIK
jgi:hypothetical protein